MSQVDTPVAAATTATGQAAAGQGAAQAAGPITHAPGADAQAMTMSASLFCGNLDPQTNESDLFEVFRNIGSIASILVVRDQVTRVSKGHAYINFYKYEDAQKAIESFAYHRIRDRKISLMWVQRDPSIRNSGVGNLFIRNLGPEIDEKLLVTLFSDVGKILSCKVPTDENGNSRGYGFVHFEKQEDADIVIRDYNNSEFNKRKVTIEHYIPRSNRPARRFTNLYVKHYPSTFTEDDLVELFSPFGTITSLCIARDEKTEKPRGFAFVNFETYEMANSALEALHNKKEFPAEDGDDKPMKLFVSEFQSRSTRVQALKTVRDARLAQNKRQFARCNLYVRGFPDTFTVEDLNAVFSKFGDIISSDIPKNPDGTSRCFGYVCMHNSEAATEAIKNLHDKTVDGITFYVAHHQAKNERDSQLSTMMPGVNSPMFAAHHPPGFIPMHFQSVPFPLGQMPPAPGAYPPQVVMFNQSRVVPHAGPYAPAFNAPHGGRNNQPGYVFPANGAVANPGAGQRRGGAHAQPRGGRDNRRNNNNAAGGNQPRGKNTGNRGQHAGQAAAATAATAAATTPAAAAAPAATTAATSTEPSLPAKLAGLGETEQKELLGEKLFEMITEENAGITEDHVCRIVGMLIYDNPTSEVLNYVDDAAARAVFVKEATVALEKEDAETAAKEAAAPAEETPATEA
ncbi:hypothetical protein H696_01730 [Fonticula alba]|uniref:Polyadenylate-binding protein n=1 Tax=Fonticula alba TaxID=691883 RepID=A0A058ZEG4_FONAL|nr:hypothetical protein H696_01730 [Fonticula alba]KCV72336.1 hypothetical protein H696_01730 [Fonticula alba]|eukprot:XP_009493914.1 hypothetical protein H696_01730 [Fonticula alba]